jgi:phosphatidylserine decarboxylase
MDKRPLTIRLEQFRQARRIHGGLFGLCAALLGIKLARLPIPSRRLRLSLYRRAFGRKYPPGVNEGEAEKPLWAYRSLNAFFTRGIRPEFRPIAAGGRRLLCPCDGTVQDVGRLERGRLLTLKGIEYTLASLAPGADTRPFEDGPFAVLFLSPIDCHRVFSPQDGHLEAVAHVPGYRLLVHPPYQRAEYPVYTLNERVVLRLATGLGPCLLVLVAGWGVGNITLPLAPAFRPRKRTAASRTLSPPVPVRAGDWVATFELGSTAVLIGPPAAGVAPLVSVNEKVKYGQPLLGYPG